MNNIFTRIYALLLILFFHDANSIGISSTMEFANESGDAIFTVTNTDNVRQYINVIVSEVRVENGQLTYIPYNRENVADWELEVTPARTIVDVKVQKDFKASYRPKGQSVNLKDKVFKLDIIPTPYFKPGEKVNGAVKFAFGVSSFIIIPAKENSSIQYSVIYEGDRVHIKNLGENYFTADMDTCETGVSSTLRGSCSKKAHLLSGRELVIDLPKEMKNKSAINILFSSSNGKVQQSSTFLNKGK
ncbi:hypothetical protein [Shewanella baltica]|uniref:Pili assembly chaperone N-terminal domain-containing protein n=1 Tax=Shewanella baltica (strain OS195) TaxID=399599 RepID=A9L067_SHEB9|nr:hypothetical protein [Shewanella baltica]ABS06753.1 hypothetical protein Shew185_0591 [Shewanella baltica OS185]ABX47796.1 hypothetical protein Sbal195_0618 [Shewanella baltica OS195]ACK45148.1 hypothetical protein Sbal223_0623 [Shewanella baltica OS223]ADT92820.1 hypothetical protein Sbal678_0632 [Shewanella baltica OS678]AEG09973.1 hypothetical protein Sbal175_0686 [Shewanella baltica BA175]